MKVICLYSNPRTGSNHICELLNSNLNIISLYEIFHTYDVKNFINNEYLDALIPYMIEHANIKFNNINDFKQQLFFFRNENMVLFFNLIINFFKKIKNIDAICFKLFDGHIIDEEIFNEIINKCDFILVLKRNVVDTFVSELKAEQTKEFINFDTTELKIIFDASKFKDYMLTSNKWYNKITRINKLLFVINYECFCDKNIEQKYSYLQKNIFDQLGIKLILNTEYTLTIFKQDKNKNIEDKIINIDEYRNIPILEKS